MQTLHYQILDPSCRAIRMILDEKRLEHHLVNTSNEQEFPILIDNNNAEITNTLVIAEYLNEVYPEPDLIGYNPLLRVDVRRIAMYFAQNIQNSITMPFLQAKYFGPHQGSISAPNSVASANVELQGFMEYLTILDNSNNWLAGPSFSIADIFAAAEISTLDYLGVIDWHKYVAVQRWYRRVKSRRSMTSILNDQIDALAPPAHYRDPDF